ncbi:4'-phosphopantetheinyl transferase family protein [Streptomyces formicae]|uniref:4'-phosphopantetheinyl transferase n=1 Tax=Streptomyces formicae TaxID=1616117 RepID=A0A291QDL2_9ACTN|nr:4'-phosphopantetheinyl transferase superfamily protein [Streptomyces formicae]ATL29587.1 4'-phosphopantetheinyl transferase [Streptomyces formicae]
MREERGGEERPAPGAPLVMVRRTADILPFVEQAHLAPYERERAARLPAGPRRRDYLAAHVLVRLCAAPLTGTPPDTLVLAQHCEDCGRDDHGRPYLPDHPGIHVSLSHTTGAVAAAASTDPVGVDVEDATAAVFDARIAHRVLAPAELAAVHADPDPVRAFLRLWVRKEALVKVGLSSLGRLRELDLTDAASLPGVTFHDPTDQHDHLIAATVTRTTHPGEQHA